MLITWLTPTRAASIGAIRNSAGVFQPTNDNEVKTYIMANTSSAKKCVRKMARKTTVNKNRRTSVRSNLRKVEDAITAGDQAAAKAALVGAEPAMMRAVGKGIFHKNTGARKISRLTKRVKAMSA